MSEPIPSRTVARPTRGRWPGLVWALPGAALLIVGYLGLQSLAHAGVDVVVTFDSAADAKPNDTEVNYKGLTIGHVSKVALDKDHSHVDITLSLDPSVKPLLRSGTRFWLVGAKPSLSDLSSLKAALSGVTIGMAPGPGEPTRRFVGTSEKPEILPDMKGAVYQLRSPTIGANRGAGVFYHGMEVGKITAVTLRAANDFQTSVFINAPYDALVRDNTLFYDASAVQISLSGSGLSTQFAPGNAVLGGGVEFDTPEGAQAQTPPATGKSFALYSDKAHALASPVGRQVYYRAEFSDPVGDLDVGAAVLLRGFRIGSVTSRALAVDFASGVVSTPVVIAIEPQRLNPGRNGGPGDAVETSTDSEIDSLIRRGYRLRLAQSPPLVGSREVELLRVAGAKGGHLEGGRTDGDGAYPMIPGAASGDLSAKLDDILSKVQQVPIVEIGANMRQLTAHLSALTGSPKLKDSLDKLDDTLTQADATLKDTRPKINRLIDNLDKASDQMRSLAASANGLISGEGATQDASLPAALRQLTAAARSMRSLADYLSRHPEAIIRGKAKSK